MRILLVEDSEKLGKSIQQGLEKHGFAVDHIENGDEAADQAIVHNASYDAIILDLMLPGRSGFDICRSLRERGMTTPILVLTAKSKTSEKVVLLNTGADDYLTKPFSFAELVARLQALLRRPKPSLSSELVVGELRMDTALHKAFIGTEELKLTTKEFSLLELFMRNPNTALGREYILEHVWDFNFDSFSNVVDVHVKNIRKKLKQSEGGISIETVEGVGYRLTASV